MKQHHEIHCVTTEHFTVQGHACVHRGVDFFIFVYVWMFECNDASTEQSRREMRPPRACTEKVSYCEDSGDEEIVKAKRESLRAYSYLKGEKTVQKGGARPRLVLFTRHWGCFSQTFALEISKPRRRIRYERARLICDRWGPIQPI